MKKNIKNIIVIVLLLISAININYVYQSFFKKDIKMIDVVENTLVITDADIAYLNSLDYYKSEKHDEYYINEKLDSGIAITSDGIKIDWDTEVDGYYLFLEYVTNMSSSYVDIDISNKQTSIGSVVIWNFNNIEPLALDIDHELYKQAVTTFIEESQNLISSLSSYEFDDGVGIPVNSLIQFHDYTLTGKTTRKGYEKCEIEYYQDKCYSKGKNLYLPSKNVNTVIIEENGYRMGTRQWISNNLLNNGQTLNQETNLEIKTPDTVQDYEIDDVDSFNNFSTQYKENLQASYDKLMVEYNQFISDFNLELTL